jgi:hypothetical protein
MAIEQLAPFSPSPQSTATPDVSGQSASKFDSMVVAQNFGRDALASFLMGFGGVFMSAAETWISQIDGALPRSLGPRDFQFADLGIKVLEKQLGTSINRTVLPELPRSSQEEFVKFAAVIGRQYSDGKLNERQAAGVLAVKLQNLLKEVRSRIFAD